MAYELVGGTPVKITELNVTKVGVYKAQEGQAFNPVVCNMDTSSWAQEIKEPYAAADGMYTAVATASDDSTVVGVCIIADGKIDSAAGDGTFAIDGTGDSPVLEWTPTVTAKTVTCYYTSRVAAAE